MRWDVLGSRCAFSLVWALASACTPARSGSDWPAVDAFFERFVQADGRVIDLTFGAKSTSEGQSYGLFMALADNRRDRFDRILKWTSDNLADGQLGPRLPAWLWGHRDDGSWGVQDSHSASDADLWLAYTLLEAGRLWQAPAYATQGRQLLAQIGRLEVVQAGGSGRLLLPGPVGFALADGRFRVNPSYLPGFMFRYLALNDRSGPWQAVWNSYVDLAPQIFRSGVAPDNVVIDSAGAAGADTESPPNGSYDAIRVYLWAGMSGQDSHDLRQRLTTYATLTQRAGVPPEKVDPRNALPVAGSYSPIGYSGALLPFLSALGRTDDVRREQARLRADAGRPGAYASSNYYDQVLILFGQGWLDGQFRFDADGRLQPRWAAPPGTPRVGAG